MSAIGFLRVGLFLVKAIDTNQFQWPRLQTPRSRVSHRHAEPIAVERCIGVTDQFAICGTVVDLQGGGWQHAARQLQQVRAVLDLAPVPGVLELLLLFRLGVLRGRLAIEKFSFIALDATGEEGRGRHLFLIAADDHHPSTEQRGQGVLDRHLRGFVVDHRIKQAGTKRQYAAGDVRVHQPYRTKVHQAQARAQFDELAQTAGTATCQSGYVFPLLAGA